MRGRLPFGILLIGLLNCQDYPFEQRLPLRSQGHQVSQNVATVTPTDILFVIDNSGSMLAQRQELNANLGTFIQQLSQSTDSFHVGIVTTDVDCNLPGRQAGCQSTANSFSTSCCNVNASGGSVVADCQDQNGSGNSNIIYSTCDGGRLRSLPGLSPYFTPPAVGNQNAWVTNVQTVISNLGCNGSSLESGLEAARRAVACSLNLPECPDPHVAQLNAGFIRADADLVIIFVSDEDDCSFMDASVYKNPNNISDPNQQAAHLCSPQECYSYYDKTTLDANGVQVWADSFFTCSTYRGSGSVPRTVNTPYPDDPNSYISYFIAAKGGDISKVRAAGILSTMSYSSAPLGFRPRACYNPGAGPTDACGCWSTTASGQSDWSFYCALTGKMGQDSNTVPFTSTVSNVCINGSSGPVSGAPQGGCKAMPAGRYVSFLESLSNQRTTASLGSDTLIDTICKSNYETTLFEIVNSVILTSCFNLGEVPPNLGSITVVLNGTTLTNVPPGSTTQGWSWIPGSAQICLEGGLRKNIGDKFNIFILDAVSTIP